MNTKRHKRHKRQSKKVKRKTKTYKKRSIRKYGGGEGEIYLKSSMYHGLPFKPVYKFIIIKEAGKGGNAESNLGKISCDKGSWRSCIKRTTRNPFHSSSLDTDSEETHLTQTLQNMYNKTNPEGNEKSFPYNKEYILRVYGKNLTEEGIEQEIHGTEYHKELSQTCSSFVCTLFDYGKIVDKKSILDWNESVYTNLSNVTNPTKVTKKYISKQEKGPYAKCKNDENCVYALLEKGEMDMMKYLGSIKMDEEAVKKILYIVAMKMIRNIYCLHRKDIMHYDIKFENCVFFPKGELKQLKVGDDIVEEICNLDKSFDNDIKLIDFGFAKKVTKENYMKYRNFEGTRDLLYIDIFNTNQELILLNSAFPDIYAVLKDVDIFLTKNEISTTSAIFGKFKTDKQGVIKIGGEIKTYYGIQPNLPKFLDEQREILQNMSEYIFTPLPYKNILNKLKEEYLDLDKSPFW
jgi:serine/threonine protein kinase